MEILALIAAVVATIIIGRLLFRVFFDDMDELLECVKYSFTPDIFSLFRGEYWDDRWKSFKLSIYLLLSIGAGLLTYFSIHGFPR